MLNSKASRIRLTLHPGNAYLFNAKSKNYPSPIRKVQISKIQPLLAICIVSINNKMSYREENYKMKMTLTTIELIKCNDIFFRMYSKITFILSSIYPLTNFSHYDLTL